MLVADTSALVSLAIAQSHAALLDEFDVHTTEQVRDELEATAEYDDVHGSAAATCLEDDGDLTVHGVVSDPFESSRIDAGEGSCVECCRSLDPDFLVTDDLPALPELQALADARVAISPIVLRALVERGRLDHTEARSRLERLAERRAWLGAPIYRRALALFET